MGGVVELWHSVKCGTCKVKLEPMEDPCCCPCNNLQSSPPPHTCVFQKQKRVDEEGEHELNQHHCENQAAPLDARLGADDHHRKYVLCLDVGTTGLRAYLYDDKTSDISRGGSYRQLPSLYPQPGWVEQDPWVPLCRFCSFVYLVARNLIVCLKLLIWWCAIAAGDLGQM